MSHEEIRALNGKTVLLNTTIPQADFPAGGIVGVVVVLENPQTKSPDVGIATVRPKGWYVVPLTTEADVARLAASEKNGTLKYTFNGAFFPNPEAN